MILDDYEERQRELHGYWGLLESGISDDLCLSFIQTKDNSFVDPAIFASNCDLVWSRDGVPCKKEDMYLQNAKNSASSRPRLSPVQTTVLATPIKSPVELPELSESDESTVAVAVVEVQEEEIRPTRPRSGSKFFYIPKQIVEILFTQEEDDDYPIPDDLKSSPCRSRFASKDSKRFWSSLASKTPKLRPIQTRTQHFGLFSQVQNAVRPSRRKRPLPCDGENASSTFPSSPTKKRRLRRQPSALLRREVAPPY